MLEIKKSDERSLVQQDKVETAVTWRTMINCLTLPFKLIGEVGRRYSSWFLISLQRYNYLEKPSLNVKRLNCGGLTGVLEAIVYDWKIIENHRQKYE